MSYEVCKDCGQVITQEAEKDLAGTWATVWTSMDGWVCEVTGNEHEPTPHRQFHFDPQTGYTFEPDADEIEDVFGVRPEGAPPMRRADHLAWAKERALAYVDTDPAMAFTSLVSDLSKHPDLSAHPGIALGYPLLRTAGGKNRGPVSVLAAEMRAHIEGYR